MQDFTYINKELGTNYKSNFDIEWLYVFKYNNLSESFMEKFQNKLVFQCISKYQVLSENFIEKYKDRLDWFFVSAYQKLSESFIEKHKDKVSWAMISKFQKLSEPFIEKHKEKLDWFYITIYQKLSESFIEKLKDKILWNNVLTYQKVSENFIEKHYNLINQNEHKSHQKILDYLKKNVWLYKDKEFKKEELIKTGKYECFDDYFIAYKAIRENRYSLYNFQYQYLPGETYESTCDSTNEDNSFGLNVGTYSFAKNYLGEKKGIVIKCKVYYEDIGRIVHDGEKIRCFKITVLE